MSPAQPFKTTTAFSFWENRIAPVFDVARTIYLLEIEEGRILKEWKETLPDDSPVQKALCLVNLNVDTLVCGAISKSMHSMITAYGIEVISFVAGDLREVIQALLAGISLRKVFPMPGCCGGGRHRMRRSDFAASDRSIALRQCVERNLAEETRQGRYGRGYGRTDETRVEGMLGDCVCPQCGHRDLHQRGIPCNKYRCAKCGSVMTRES